VYIIVAFFYSVEWVGDGWNANNDDVK